MRGGQASSQHVLAHEKKLSSTWPMEWAQPGQHHRTRERVGVAIVAFVSWDDCIQKWGGRAPDHMSKRAPEMSGVTVRGFAAQAGKEACSGI